MGKIRIKTLGTEEEGAQKEKGKRRREEKKKRLTHIAGLRGGERVIDMSTTAPEVPEAVEIPRGWQAEAPAEAMTPPTVKGKKKIPRSRGKAYLKAKKLIEPSKLYPISQAVELVKKTSLSKFDGTVEVHINTTEKGIRGQVNLPHGTGRKTRVAIADENLISEIEKGKIDFDILVANQVIMPKLAKVAKILGPRGLMPNPKNGTISIEPEKLALSLSKGQIQFKTEPAAPIIHFVLGKVSFPIKHLEENFKALISAIDPQKIKSVFLTSTMSPAIKVKFLPN